MSGIDEPMHRIHSNSADQHSLLAASFTRIAGLAGAVVLSFVAAASAPYVYRFGPKFDQMLNSSHAIYLPILFLMGCGLVYYLVKNAEIAVSMFYLVGFFKGDPRLESVPVDLTIAIALIMMIAMLVRLLFVGQELKLPTAFLFYLPILFLMFFSLLYTPNFEAGLDKTLRFTLLTCFGAVSPFLLVDTPERIKRFLFGLVVGGVVMSINALFMLGGNDRLVSPSGVTIALGLSAGLGIAIIWSLYFPRLSLIQRVLLYPILGVLLIALIGSGARLANVGAVACLAIALFYYRNLFVDVAITATLGIMALPFVRIPEASFEYLASLTRPHDAFGTRSGLMDLGLHTFMSHPLLGVGVQGYRFLSPNPITYNYAHNLLLEMGSELGVFAVIAFLALVACSFRVMFRLLRDTSSPDILVYRCVFCVMILPALDICVAGDMNNDKLSWFMFSMPFVLQAYSASRPQPFVSRSQEPARVLRRLEATTSR